MCALRSLSFFLHSFLFPFLLKQPDLGFFFFFKYFSFWLCWVLISVRGLSLVVASGGHSSSQCMGLSLSWPLLLRSTGSRRAGSVIVAHGPSCSAACGIFPDQGLNPCPLHWQADSQPLRHQGSPSSPFASCGDFCEVSGGCSWSGAPWGTQKNSSWTELASREWASSGKLHHCTISFMKNVLGTDFYLLKF